MYRAVVHGETESYVMSYYMVDIEGNYGVRICSVRGDGIQRSCLLSKVFVDYMSCLRCLHMLFRSGVGPIGLEETVGS